MAQRTKQSAVLFNFHAVVVFFLLRRSCHMQFFHLCARSKFTYFDFISGCSCPAQSFNMLFHCLVRPIMLTQRMALWFHSIQYVFPMFSTYQVHCQSLLHWPPSTVTGLFQDMQKSTFSNTKTYHKQCRAIPRVRFACHFGPPNVQTASKGVSTLVAW